MLRSLLPPYPLPLLFAGPSEKEEMEMALNAASIFSGLNALLLLFAFAAPECAV
jgi:hypothetical protein